MTPLARTHTPSPADLLLTGTTVDRYRTLVTDGVDRVAKRIGSVDGPVTGITAAEIEDAVAGIDLDRPVVFRFLAAILHTGGLLPEDEFWATVAACVADHQRSAPELAERFARYDLFAETFALSCLNRLQLRNNRQMVDLADPAGSLAIVGELDNPLARHRP